MRAGWAMAERGGPAYYQGEGGMQPFDVIDAFGLDFYEGNCVKYIVRWRKKGGIEDLYKARRYIDEVITRAMAADGPAHSATCCDPGCFGRCLTGTVPDG